MFPHDIINDMTIDERTQKYICRRQAELRGEIHKSLLDEHTEAYIKWRLEQLQGKTQLSQPNEDHPYIKRRLAEIKKQSA